MKKTYETPSVEKIAFKYRDQVVVASSTGLHTCEYNHELQGDSTPEQCCTGTHWWSGDNNH